MNVDSMTVWLAGSVLFALGCVIIVAAVIVINNLLNRFWKPVTIFTRESFSLFGNGYFHTTDPMSSLTQEEYDRLVLHLEEMRKSKEKQTS